MPRMYGGPAYQMGSDELSVAASATAPITRGHAVAAQAELRRMKRALTTWLKYRQINDQPPAHIRTFVAAGPDAALVQRRYAHEQRLADCLHCLLSEAFDASTLPGKDVARDPNAAVALAQIAISGKLPGDKVSAVGSVALAPWVWPMVIAVGAIAYVITTQIRSSADAAAEREKYECIQAGKCTDTGFWLKAAAVLFIGWFLWEKAGLGKRLLGKGAAT